MSRPFNTADKVLLREPLKQYIDVNTDLGQSQDTAVFSKDDYALLQYVSSVNLPCCVHDGNPLDIKQMIIRATDNHCAIGAHIGLPDPVNYGYSMMDIADDELAAWIHVQLGALSALMKEQNLELNHVRPHGALYGVFIQDVNRARIVAQAVSKFSTWLPLIAPAGKILDTVHEEIGLTVVPEVYLGKRYGSNGMLLQDEFHHDLNAQGTLDQARQFIQDRKLTTADGKTLDVAYKTIHLSPRLENAPKVAEKMYHMLEKPVSLPVMSVGESGWV